MDPAGWAARHRACGPAVTPVRVRATIPTVASMSTFISFREAAQRLGVHENTVRRYADRGLIRAVRLPSGVRRLARTDVEAMQPSPDEPSAAAAIDRPTATLDELIEAAGAGPISDLTALARPDLWHSEEDVDRFIALTRTERDHDR
jgi:excisionase family DNA binding protein